MKVYCHVSLEGYTNSYTILNDEGERGAIIVDPVKITMDEINLIEGGGYNLAGVLVTHGHTHHVAGLKTLQKIYAPAVYAADSELCGIACSILNGDGILRLAGLDVVHYSVPGHSIDSMVYSIGDMLFTGDTLSSGVTGGTLSQYSHRLLCSRIREKLLALPDRTIVFPGHGCPGTIGSERRYNLDLIEGGRTAGGAAGAG